MSLSSETWSQTTRINTHRHTPKLLYFSDIAVNCLVCNISTEKLLKTKTTSLNNRRTLFLVFTLPFVQLKTHNRLFIVIKTFKEGGVGGKAFIVLIISIIILQQYCFLPWNITEQTEDEWKWEQSSRGRQEKEGASGASTALFCQRQSNFYFTLWDQQYTLYSQTHRSVLLPVSKTEARALPFPINLPSVIDEPQSRIIFIKLCICDSFAGAWWESTVGKWETKLNCMLSDMSQIDMINWSHVSDFYEARTSFSSHAIMKLIFFGFERNISTSVETIAMKSLTFPSG